MYPATRGIYSITSWFRYALMAQWYIEPIVHLTTGVRAPKMSKPFCWDLHVFCRVDFSSMRPLHCMCTTFYAQLVTYIKYLHILTYTCIYMLIHTHTCSYIRIPANTYIYCMYVNVWACIACICRYVCICRYCLYEKVLQVCVGITLYVCIACMHRYCWYLQVWWYP